MSYVLINNAMAVPLPPTRRAVLLALADMANHTGLCWPSITTLAQKCCVSVRSVFSHLKALEAGGLLTRRARTGRSSVYRLNLLASAQGEQFTGQPDTQPNTIQTGDTQPNTTHASGPQASATPTSIPPPTPTPQPVPQTPPAPAHAARPTLGSVLACMQQAGLVGAHAHTPLAALVASATGTAEFTEAAQEAARRGKGLAWAAARVAGRRATPGATPLDHARATVPSNPGRDPVLIQLENDAARATPPPPSVRERLAQLRSTFMGKAAAHSPSRAAERLAN